MSILLTRPPPPLPRPPHIQVMTHNHRTNNSGSQVCLVVILIGADRNTVHPEAAHDRAARLALLDEEGVGHEEDALAVVLVQAALRYGVVALRLHNQMKR